MTNIIKELKEKKLINPPEWLVSNTHYCCIMGSVAYGVSSDTSDMDCYGWTIPPRKELFPHLDGEIPGFGTPKERFQQFLQHHIFDSDALGGKGRQYDISIFNIVKYFNLCMECNPNMIDSMYVPQNCILHSTNISNFVRDNRELFLSKLAWPRLKGYAFSQLHKATSKNPTGKRKELREKFGGMDVKFLYHVVRLLSQAEQIFTEGTLDLQEKGRREHLKAIRRGEISEKDIRDWASEKEKHMEKLYSESKLPAKPDETKIKNLLLKCLEMHYGSMDKCIEQTGWAEQALRDIHAIVESHRNNLF